MGTMNSNIPEWAESTDEERLDIEISKRQNSLNEFSLIESTVTSIDGKKTYQIVYSTTDLQATILETVILDGENLWWFYAQVDGEQSAWQEYEDLIKTSVQSFRIVKQ